MTFGYIAFKGAAAGFYGLVICLAARLAGVIAHYGIDDGDLVGPPLWTLVMLIISDFMVARFFDGAADLLLKGDADR